jgi:MFS family permease
LLAIEVATWYGAYATPVVLAFAVLDQGGHSGQVGIVLAADTIGMLVIAPYGGVVADRLPRNLVMCLSEVAAASFQCLAVLVLFSGSGVEWLAPLQGLVGLSRGFFHPAATGLVPALIADDRVRQRANGLLGTAQATARLAAPALAGLIVATVGAEVALSVNLVAYATSAVLLVGVPRTRAPKQHEPALAAIRRGWREVRSREWLWLTVVWFSALQCVAQAPLLVLGPVIAQRALHGSAGWGLVMGSLGGGCAAGAALAAVLPLRRALRPAIAAYALYALPLVALGERLPLPYVATSAALAGTSAGFFAASWFTLFQRNVPREAISRTSAWDWEASLAGLPLGMVIAPQVASLVGAPLTLITAGAATVALTSLVVKRTSLDAPTTSIDRPIRRSCGMGVGRNGTGRPRKAATHRYDERSLAVIEGRTATPSNLP